MALGHTEDEARRVAEAFEAHDVKMLLESYSVRHDQAAYVGFVRRSTEMLEAVMLADLKSAEESRGSLADEPAGIDKEAKPGSDRD